MTPFELGLVLVSALLHASWNTATKGSENPTAFLLGIEVLTAVVSLPLLFLFVFSEIATQVWWLLAGTGVTHSLYAFWLTRAYVHGELTLVYPIARSTPAFVPLLAIPLLGESVSISGAAGIALVVCGIWAVQTEGRLRIGELTSLGAIFAYLTLATTVVYSLIDKQSMHLLGEAAWSSPVPRAIVYMVLLYYFYIPLFAALSLPKVGWRAVQTVLRRETGAVVGSALCGVASYSLILHVMQTAPVSYVVAVRQSSVLFAVLLGVLFLRERPGRVRVLGAASTVAGVALISFYA
jgi:drug/metabolite transporter (DMT)-like permease